jgi:NAD(P)-dependent dehydrogenase (short-subunit alcohol dehydrogenase family)
MNPVYDFANQVALVTGTASGTGLATVTAFAGAGGAVVLAEVKEQAVSAATEPSRGGIPGDRHRMRRKLATRQSA